MSARPPLGGVTLPVDYSIALMDWRRERDQRKAAVKDAGGPIKALEAGLPDPRGWWKYAIDPRGDGAPTSNQSTEIGKLDSASPQNTDSLVLTNWWDIAQAGRNEKQIMQYMQMMRSEIDDWKDMPAIINYGMESFSPDIYVPTTMADYVPNMFNIFQDEHGNRDDPTNYGGFWKRTGVTAGQGIIGYGLIGATLFGITLISPKVVERGMEVTEQIIVGTLEIAEKVVQKTADIVNPFSAKRKLQKHTTRKYMGDD
jgi:hypothetical protein